MRLRGFAPEAGEHCGDDYVLLGLGEFTEGGAGFGAFEEHCVVFGVGFEESDGGIAGPELETVDFVEGFEVGHADFEDGTGAIRELGGGDERGGDFGGVEGGT